MMAVLVLSMADSWLVRFELGIGVGVRAVNQTGKSEGAVFEKKRRESKGVEVRT